MENDPKPTARDDETLPTNDEHPSLDAAADDAENAGKTAVPNGGGAKTITFPGLKSGEGARRLDDSFGKPDIAFFPELGNDQPTPPEAPVVEAAAEAPVTLEPMTLDDGTGWDSTGSIDKPQSLRARIEMQDDEQPVEMEAEAEELERPMVAAPPRHEANVTPFPGLHRQADPAPSDMLRGGTSAEVFEEITAHAGEEPGESGEVAGSQDELADAVQSALRNIYGGYSEPSDEGAEPEYAVADALAGPEAASDDWRGRRRPFEIEQENTEELDHVFGQRRPERSAGEMSLSEYAARASSLGEKWQPDPEPEEPPQTIFSGRTDNRLRGRDFQPEPPPLMRGGGAGGGYFHEEPVRPSLEPQWGQPPYAAPQNARGTITPTYVPATATPADQLAAQGPDSGHLLGAAGLGLIGGIALAGVLAVFVFNSFVDETGQSVTDPKVVERLAPPQTASTTAPPAAPARPVQENRAEEQPPVQTAATATATPEPEPEPRSDPSGRPRLTAAPAAGAPDTPIKLNIALMSGDVGDALVSLKGLPKEAKLSTGIDVGGGQWLLPPGRLRDLTVVTPGNASGQYQLEAQLLKDDAQTSISDAVPFVLNVGAGGAKPAAPASAPSPAPAGAQPSPSVAPAAPKPDNSRLALLPDETPLPETDFLTQMLIRDGNKKMREGDIAAARRLYEQAAQSGNAEAALAMGRSYDPTYFEKLTVKTGKPDPATAFEWYKRALDGGLLAAKVKIEALKQWLQR